MWTTQLAKTGLPFIEMSHNPVSIEDSGGNISTSTLGRKYRIVWHMVSSGASARGCRVQVVEPVVAQRGRYAISEILSNIHNPLTSM